MATQQQIAKHLDISQPQVSKLMLKLGIDWDKASMDDIRKKYINNLRDQAASYQSGEEMNLIKERVLTERVDRELKELLLSEKKNQLINVSQLEPALIQMTTKYRAELLACDDKLKSELDSLYAVNIDLNILNEHTNNALSQLTRHHEIASPNDGKLSYDL